MTTTTINNNYNEKKIHANAAAAATATTAARRNAGVKATAKTANDAIVAITGFIGLADITDKTTLNELIALARNNAIEKPKTTPKFATLRKNNRCVAVYQSEDHRCNLFVYDNGYAGYETDDRKTVIDLDEFSSVKYETMYSDLNFERSDFDCDWLENLPWASALMLLGEEQVSRNIFEDKAHECIGEGDYDEDEDETTKPNNPVFTAHIDDPETAYIRRETRNEIKRAVSKARYQMTVKQDEVFRLYYDQSMTLIEISRILGIGIQSVSERLGWALKKICKNMEQFL